MSLCVNQRLFILGSKRSLVSSSLLSTRSWSIQSLPYFTFIHLFICRFLHLYRKIYIKPSVLSFSNIWLSLFPENYIHVLTPSGSPSSEPYSVLSGIPSRVDALNTPLILLPILDRVRASPLLPPVLKLCKMSSILTNIKLVFNYTTIKGEHWKSCWGQSMA